jgi:hypothetical protein
MTSDLERQDQQHLDLKGLELPKDAPKELEDLRAEIESQMTLDSLNVLREYCQNHNVDYQSWASETLEPQHIEEIRISLSTILPGVGIGERLASSLSQGPESPSYKYAKQIVDFISNGVKEKEETFQEFVGHREDVTSEMVSGVMGTAAEKLKDGFAEHPILTSVAAIAAVVIGYNVVQLEFPIPGFDAEKSKKKWFQTGLLLAGAAWTGNFLTETFSDKSIVGHIEGLLGEEGSEDKLSGAIDSIPGLSKAEAESLRHSLTLGEIPFEYFLEAYKKSRKDQSYSINMKTLRGNKWGSKLPDKYFRKEYGDAMYKELEALIGNDSGTFHDKYSKRKPEHGKKGYYSLQEVMFRETTGDTTNVPTSPKDNPGGGTAASAAPSSDTVDTVTGAAVASTAGAAVAAGVATTSPSSSREDVSGSVPGLTSRAEFKVFSPELQDGHNGSTLMGFPVSYRSKTYTEGPDMTQHLFTDETHDRRFAFRLREEMRSSDEGAFRAECSEMKEYFEARMEDLFAGTGLDGYSPQWENGEWTVSPTFSYEFQGNKASVPLKLKITENNELYIVYKHHEARTISALKPQLKMIAYESGIEAAFARDPELKAFKGLEVKIKNVDTPPYSGSLGGLADFNFGYNPAKETYEILHIDMSTALRDHLVEGAEKSDDINDLFDDFKAAGEQMGNWRWVPKVLALDFTPNKNHYWNELVEFKRDQVLEFYRDSLNDLRGNVTPAQIDLAYEDTIGQAKRQLSSLPAELRKEDPATYERTQRAFETHGFSRSYATQYELFLEQLDGSGIDLQGVAAKHDEKYNELLFKIKRQWFEHSKVLHDRDLTPSQVTWVQGLNEALIDEIRKAERTDANWWQTWFDSGVSSDEYATVAGLLGTIPDYDDTVDPIDELAAEGLKDVLGAMDPDEYEIDKTDPTKVRITFKNTHPEVLWIFDTTMKSAEKFSLTNDLINLKVMSLETNKDFNRPFGNLSRVFAAMEETNFWDWENITSGYFGEFFQGTVADNAWESLVEYKRDEAAIHYRMALQEAAATHSDPADLRDAVAQIDANLVQNYAGSIQKMTVEIQKQIDQKSSEDPPGRFDAQEFLGIYDMLAESGYTKEYSSEITAFRKQLGYFDFTGPEALGGRTPHEIMNRLVLIHESYTGQFRNIERLTPMHVAYIQHVRMGIMQTVREAQINNKDVTGWFLDNVVGADEIPHDFDIQSFDEFRTDNPTISEDWPASMPPIPIIPGITGVPTQEQMSAYGKGIYAELTTVYNSWDQSKYRPLLGATTHNQEALRKAIPAARQARDFHFVRIINDPSKKAEILKQYEDQLEAILDSCKRGKAARAWTYVTTLGGRI